MANMVRSSTGAGFCSGRDSMPSRAFAVQTGRFLCLRRGGGVDSPRSFASGSSRRRGGCGAWGRFWPAGAGFIRISYASSYEEIEEALERIKLFVQSLGGRPDDTIRQSSYDHRRRQGHRRAISQRLAREVRIWCSGPDGGARKRWPARPGALGAGLVLLETHPKRRPWRRRSIKPSRPSARSTFW